MKNTWMFLLVICPIHLLEAWLPPHFQTSSSMHVLVAFSPAILWYSKNKFFWKENETWQFSRLIAVVSPREFMPWHASVFTVSLQNWRMQQIKTTDLHLTHIYYLTIIVALTCMTPISSPLCCNWVHVVAFNRWRQRTWGKAKMQALCCSFFSQLRCILTALNAGRCIKH